MNNPYFRAIFVAGLMVSISPVIASEPNDGQMEPHQTINNRALQIPPPPPGPYQSTALSDMGQADEGKRMLMSGKTPHMMDRESGQQDVRAENSIKSPLLSPRRPPMMDVWQNPESMWMPMRPFEADRFRPMQDQTRSRYGRVQPRPPSFYETPERYGQRYMPPQQMAPRYYMNERHNYPGQMMQPHHGMQQNIPGPSTMPMWNDFNVPMSNHPGRQNPMNRQGVNGPITNNGIGYK